MYSFRPALRAVDLDIAFGERVALLGPNGAGKSTLLRLLATLERPTAGRLWLAGREVPRDAADVRHLIGLVAHQTLLYDELTARENLLFYGRLYSLPALDARVDEALDRLGLATRQHDRVRTLSRGMQQRLSIARAILHDPVLLLLDEPDTGLDAAAQATLADTFVTSDGRRRTVVMATHAPARAAQLCDRALALDRGRVVDDGPATPCVPAPFLHPGTRAPSTPNPFPHQGGRG
ncbi:MAG: ABC transporter ATP-binding protein, partial [Chloroflexi bacterium]|nr:ABC transporter ATP-binding protein [Chloroflexota bacterium]